MCYRCRRHGNYTVRKLRQENSVVPEMLVLDHPKSRQEARSLRSPFVLDINSACRAVSYVDQVDQSNVSGTLIPEGEFSRTLIQMLFLVLVGVAFSGEFFHAD